MSTENKPEEPKKQQIDWANIEDDHPEEATDPKSEVKTDQPKKVVQHRNIDGNQPKHKGFGNSTGGPKTYSNNKFHKGPAKHNPNQTDNVVANIEKFEKAREQAKPITAAQNIFECDDLENDDEVEEEEEKKVEKPQKKDNFLKEFTNAKPAEADKQKEEQALSKQELKQKEMEEFEQALQQFGPTTTTPATTNEKPEEQKETQPEEKKEEAGGDQKKQKQKQKAPETPAATTTTTTETPATTEVKTEAPAEPIDKELAIKQALMKRMGNQNDKSQKQADIEAAKAEILQRQAKAKQNKNDFDL